MLCAYYAPGRPWDKPLFSTHRKRFKHWDSGKDFVADFQNQEAWEESETRKTENPHFQRFGANFDKNWYNTSF